ncbi:MAG: CDGSH iron-sulfur domain-containing protein [Gammaproteobacteria bacterium]|nr:CDGSH iron-sulfur domain-containing protein [Gammaproteobacteria bacterium]
MPKPRVAARGPVQVTLEEGRRYSWCACGRSSSQPFCDGTHATLGEEDAACGGRSTATMSSPAASDSWRSKA